jgi:MATE family multidrug resistance protein
MSESPEQPAALPAPTFRGALCEVALMAVPIIVSMASMTVMMFVDQLMVAKYAAWRQRGDAMFAAVDQAGILLAVLMALPHGTLSLTSTMASQSLGAGRPRQASHYAWQAVWLSLLVGLVAAALWPLAGRLFAAAGHEPQVRAHEVVYFNWRLIGIPAGCACVALSSFMQGVHRPIWSMLCALVANAFNILANYVLIFGAWGFPEWGLKGAAIATSAADWVQASLLAAVLLGPLHKRFRGRDSWRYDGPRLVELLKVGLPNGGQLLAEMASWGFFIFLLIARFGKAAMAGNAAAVKFLMLSFVPCVGLGMSATAVVGRYIGRGDLRLARQRGIAALTLGLVYMGALGLLFALLRRWFVGHFVHEPAAIEVGARIMVVAGIFQVFNAMAIVSTGCLRGAGDTKFTAVTQVILALAIFAPLALVFTYVGPLARVVGPVGPWLGGAVYMVVMGPTFARRFLSGAWKRIDIFASERQKDAPGRSDGADA